MQPQNMMQRKRVVIYCRVSTDKQEQDGESLEYQEAVKRRNQTREITLDGYEGEWFTINKLIEDKVVTWHSIHRAIDRGEVQLHTIDEPHPFIHRDELNRFLRETPVRTRSERENVAPRVEITYTPIFTGVQSSFDKSTKRRSCL